MNSDSFESNAFLLRAYTKGCSQVSHHFAPDDEMMINGKLTPEIYLYGGRSALKICTDALVRANAKFPSRILDFPSGHGRVLRYLRAAFPQAVIYAGDINDSGLKFCRKHFEAETFLSNVDLSRVRLPDNIDLIWCGSLVTHFNESRAKQLMSMLFESLAPDGICLFTTHGRMYARFINGVTPILDAPSWDSILRDYYRTGFGYKDYPSLAHLQFGISMTSPGWIFEQLYVRDDLTVLFFAEKAWHGQQDVTAVQKRSLSTWYDPNVA
jgi:SAM-dependent methyltransferase